MPRLKDITDRQMVVDEPVELPQVFGRYLLLQRISRGGMGEIYLSKGGDVQGFEKLFIIKKILPKLSRDQEFIQRFVEEAQIAIKLNHINIVPVFEVGLVDKDYFLALEFLEGRDLRRILSRSHELNIRIPVDVSLCIAREICNGLAYAHRRTDEQGRSLHLVHCDISPPNILVSLEGEVKIIDFGVARSVLQAQESEPTTGFGKLGYMSPEQLLKGRKVDYRADLYSAGVVLYEMLVGDRMIDLDPEEDYRLNVRRIVLDPVIPPSQRVKGLDTRLDTMILKAVSKNPKERFQSATELRDEIQRLLSEMNPTMSADNLAAYLKSTFASEIQHDRDLIKQAHATDLAPYRRELDHATEATVSYAVTAIWDMPQPSMEQPSLKQPPLKQPPLPLLPPPPPDEPDMTLPPVQADDFLRPHRRRRNIAIGVAVGVVLAAAAALAFWIRPWASKESSSKGHEKVAQTDAQANRNEQPAGTARGPNGGAGATVTSLNANANSPNVPNEPPRGRTPPTRREPPMNARPRTARPRIHRTRPRATRARPRGRRRRRARPPDPPPRPAGPDPAAVNRKFKRVKREYARFRVRYGQRLERQWQAILRTAVWSGSAKYKRLNSMLDSLRRRMRKIRQKEGQ